MTMHDDPDLRLLEDDLRKLAEPSEDDERLRLALRNQLANRSRPQPQWPRRRLSTRLAVGVATAAAVAAVTIVALVGSAGSSGPTAADAAIIHHTLRAIWNNQPAKLPWPRKRSSRSSAVVNTWLVTSSHVAGSLIRIRT